MATAANEARWRAGAASVLSEAVGAADARSASSGSGVEGVAGGCVGAEAAAPWQARARARSVFLIILRGPSASPRP